MAEKKKKPVKKAPTVKKKTEKAPPAKEKEPKPKAGVNNFPAFKTELYNVMVNTANLDANFKKKMPDRFVTAYPAQWEAYKAAGNPDNGASRGKFLIEMTFENFWENIWTAQSLKENVQQTPPPDPWA